jgi:hypothetical protein
MYYTQLTRYPFNFNFLHIYLYPIILERVNFTSGPVSFHSDLGSCIFHIHLPTFVSSSRLCPSTCKVHTRLPKLVMSSYLRSTTCKLHTWALDLYYCIILIHLTPPTLISRRTHIVKLHMPTYLHDHTTRHHGSPCHYPCCPPYWALVIVALLAPSYSFLSSAMRTPMLSISP